MVRRISFLILILSSLLLFSKEVLFNTYNNTGIVSLTNRTFPFENSRDLEPFKASLETIYTPPKVRGITIDLPDSTALVLSNGVTIGVDVGDIRIPEDVFAELLDSTDLTFVYDAFPIEVFSRDRVVVKGSITKEKLEYYLSFFFKKFEVPRRIEGTIDVTPKPPEVRYSKVWHPLIGTVIFLNVTDDSTFVTLWNGREGKLWYQTTEATRLEVEVVDSLGQSTSLSFEALPVSFAERSYQSSVEFGQSLILPPLVNWFLPSTGEKITVFSPEFPGVYHLIGCDESGNFLRMEIDVRDTTPPLVLSPEKIEDASSFRVEYICDGREVQKIPDGHHVVFVKATDTFGNTSTAFFVVNRPHRVIVRERPVPVYLGPKRKIQIGGLSLKGSLIFGWTREEVEVMMGEEVYKLEK
ncbi:MULTISPECIES: hypothetical protein [Thermotoga]|jgi:hypothetical protein|uniref:hypothetical protein n=1 Tax=Thermotoga TaxID=2335 RepID=UPI000540CD35|nr:MULTISPECIES: hypothetical protein [unclassified Thermotoga]MBZ4661057.1 hypothetical protein [Thermotoga sp.]AIY89050.1 hypothetical protein CELL2_09160 [Thermotoga sp. Cell2]KHC93221.1 hypothetical protein TBGT1765_04392 [Thermotoga sp. TBGT1765]KHC94629.1 hypothetical protein TBGT1766_04069 [Thermotoga sp. TBGT1766]KHC95928.1 hypothetical protein XYL54_05941 [Thermotoga sp. Xyl54]